jgi:DNA-binding MarR family transcriptional regulator
MIIGSEFNKKCNLFLKQAGILANLKQNQNVSVVEINESLNFERSEIQAILEYLNETEMVVLETIGGPLLYGHISLTKKGVSKLKESK